VRRDARRTGLHHSRRPVNIVLVKHMGLAFLALAIAATATAATPANSEYVDARVCAKCHRQIAEDYARTCMGRSFVRPAASSVDTVGDFYHALSDTHFSILLRDGQHLQRRWQIGFGEKETNVEELRIDYIMG